EVARELKRSLRVESLSAALKALRHQKSGQINRFAASEVVPFHKILCELLLDPFQRALFPDPDITDHQDQEKDQDFDQAKHAKRFEHHGPGKQEDRLP